MRPPDWYANLDPTSRILLWYGLVCVAFCLYFVAPTPYVQTTGTLPSPRGEVPTQEYRIQINRFTGTMWAETMTGWRRVDGKPLGLSRLAFEEETSEWYDPSESDADRREMRY